MRTFESPPRQAPGFPPGCADAGDVLAGVEGSAVTVFVVTTALRNTIEAQGDHIRGLELVRSELAQFATTLPSAWRAGFYGKDLIAVHPGAKPSMAMAIGETLPADSRTRMGWSWTTVALSGSPSRRISTLLAACYRAGVAARVRRNYSGLQASEAQQSLEEWRAQRPNPCEHEVASMLAAVLVRPYGAQEVAVGDGDDPRWPGVRRGDRIGELASAPEMPFYVITDVHGVEWGLKKGSAPTVGTNATTSAEGNATRLLPVARAWLAAERSTAMTLDAAYNDRLDREQSLAVHLRSLSCQPGMLFGTLGDGLEGMVPSKDYFRTILTATNASNEGRLRSGAGVARAQKADAAGRDVARRQAEFSLHVTKLLAPEDTPFAELHVFGEPLPARESRIVLDRLLHLRDRPSHHWHHARRHADHWVRHLPPASHREFIDALGTPLHRHEAESQWSDAP